MHQHFFRAPPSPVEIVCSRGCGDILNHQSHIKSITQRHSYREGPIKSFTRIQTPVRQREKCKRYICCKSLVLTLKWRILLTWPTPSRPRICATCVSSSVGKTCAEKLFSLFSNVFLLTFGVAEFCISFNFAYLPVGPQRTLGDLSRIQG